MSFKDGFSALIILPQSFHDLIELKSQVLFQFSIMIHNSGLIAVNGLHHEGDFSGFHYHLFFVSHVEAQQSGLGLLQSEQSVSSSVMRLSAFRTDQTMSVAFFTAISTKIFIDLIVFRASNLDQHFIAIRYALNRSSSCHILAGFSNLSSWSIHTDLWLCSSVDVLISDEQLLIFVRLLRCQDQMPEIIENSLFGAGWAGELILCFYLSE